MTNKQINYLHRRNVELKLLKRQNVRDSMIEVLANSAFIEMLLKVKQTTNEEAREFWETNLKRVELSLDLVKEYKNELALADYQYTQLHKEYSELVDRINKLEKEF